jgi:DNA-binding MarR family transcriptional regulator
MALSGRSIGRKTLEEADPFISGEESDANVGLLIRHTFRTFTRALQFVTAPAGLTASEFRVLRTLAMEGGMTQVRIAALAGMDRPYAAFIVKQLRAKRYLITKPDRLDGRRTNLTLSVRGRQLVTKITKQLAVVNQRALKGISAAEYRVFTDVIGRMKANLDAFGSDHDALSD